MNTQAAYQELMQRTRQDELLASCLELLSWDELTYMPRAGAAQRGEQMALLSGIYHDRAVDARIGELLGELENSTLVGDPLAPAAVNVREIRRAHQRMSRVPRSLVEELARVTTLAQHEWEAARRESDFPRFRPWLQKVIVLKRREADALGYEADPYDALLEEHEPGARSTDLARLFDALRRELVPLVNRLTPPADMSVLRREYPLDRQESFGKAVAAALGFDFEAGRLDTTVHPFCSAIGPGDCRLATRYDVHDFSDAFFSILHEVGHGLYEQGLDPDHQGTPIGEVPSVALHESQARLWENTVGRSRPFWEHFYPRARAHFPGALGDVKLDDFHLAVNHVERSPIRATADEVTYNLHILVRFDLERALIAGNLEVAELPGAWNEAYRQYLGITPRSDAEGCLQDGHWGAGLIGYFPTYTLGNLFAAQLFSRAAVELADLDCSFARGRFDGLLGWLREKIYRQGHRYPAGRLIEQATGRPPDYRPFIEYLSNKYTALYSI